MQAHIDVAGAFCHQVSPCKLMVTGHTKGEKRLILMVWWETMRLNVCVYIYIYIYIAESYSGMRTHIPSTPFV